jgi:hypothetical protein
MKLPKLESFSKSLNFARKRSEKQTLNSDQTLRFLLLLSLLSTFFSFLFSNYTRFSVPAYSVGDIARADVVVPIDLVIKDDEATEARKTTARASVSPVYRYDSSEAQQTISRLSKAFAQCRSILDAAVPPRRSSRKGLTVGFDKLPVKTKAELVSEISKVAMASDPLLNLMVERRFSPDLEKLFEEGLSQGVSSFLVQDERRLVPEKASLQVINTITQKETTVPRDQVLTLQQAHKRITELINRSSQYPAKVNTPVEELLFSLLEPNLKFDLQMTEARQAEAASNVDPILRQLKKGKVILRQGDEVGPEHLSQIEVIRKSTPSTFSLKQFIGTTILIASFLVIFGYYLRPFSGGQWGYAKLLALCSLIVTTNLILLKTFWFISDSLSKNFVASPFNDNTYFYFALPFASGPMLVTLLAGEQTALLFLIFFSVLAGQAVPSDSYGFFYLLISSLVGILVVRTAVQRVAIVGSGFKLGLSSVGLFILVQLSKQASLDVSSLTFGAALAFLSGPINASLLVFALPLCERLFLVTTEIRLSELGNLNLPLIRELILKAPGTYSHSVAVGTLAEAAAKAVGLNPLFVRVACLYHDIGKSLRPEYFVENQAGGNPHDQISPEESARIVKEHVSEGIRIARAANLPPAIVDIIPQHHGTKSLTLFFEKAKKMAGSQSVKVRPEDFRYPGPKPQSKEAAIIMLADAVEAAARTLEDHSQERLLELTQRIVSSTAEDGQFSECEITLADLERITFSFVQTLSSFYHSRITYPGFDFNQRNTQGKTQATVGAVIPR